MRALGHSQDYAPETASTTSGTARRRIGSITSQQSADEKNRREPLGQVKRELWVLSGNECAWDGCRQRLFDEDGAWIGKIAHIVGAEEGSARHDRDWTTEQLRDVSNLVRQQPFGL